MDGCEAFGMRLFAQLATFCAARPCVAIGLNFFVAILCGLGFMAIEVETKGDRLWVDQESLLKEQMEYITDTYAVQPRVSFVTVTTNPVGGDALTAGPMGLLTTLHDQILDLKTLDGFRWSDVCVRDVYGRCRVTGAMGFFSTLRSGIDSTIFTSDATTENIKNRVQRPEGRPWATPEHIPVESDSYFMGWDEATTSAQGARSYYFLQGEFEGRCEREGLAAADCTTNKKEEVQKELEDLMIELVEPYMLHNKVGGVQKPSNDGLIYLQAFRSLDDELLRAVSGDIVLFALTMNIMCTFCCIILGHTCGGHCMSSRFLLANGGIGIVMFAMISGYGLSAGLGFAFTQLQQILPFILIGIGVDDMLIIVSAFDRVTIEHPDMSIEERVGKAYARCGLSISLTSATDVMAFILGSLSKLPAIHVFCVYASAAIFFTFCFMCTGFAGMVALDTRRQESHRYDCLPCIKSKASNDVTAVPEQNRMLQRGFKLYASYLLKPPVKIAVLLLFAAVLSANTWGWTQTTSGFDLVDLTPDESYVRDFVNLNTDLLGSATGKIPFQVYTKDLSYHTRATHTSYQALHDAIAADPKVEASTVNSWFLEFMKSSAVPDASNRDAERWYNAATFYPALFEWLNARNSDGLRVNQRFENDIVWIDPSDPEQGIRAARFAGSHPLAVSSTSEQQVQCLEAMEAIQAASSLEPKPFIWTFFYLFFDQFRTIYGDCAQSPSFTSLSCAKEVQPTDALY
eukprot:COSAG02_NODE_493_length_21166_cov_13.181318_16_plen_742_part_00